MTARRVGTGVVGCTVGGLTGEVTVGSRPTRHHIDELRSCLRPHVAPDRQSRWYGTRYISSYRNPSGRRVELESGRPDDHLQVVGARRTASSSAGQRRTFSANPRGRVPAPRRCAPQYSLDGSWVYFQGATYTGNQVVFGEIWRVHPDGTGYERVGPAGSSNSADLNPTPSPDGTRVAFVSDRGHRSRFHPPGADHRQWSGDRARAERIRSSLVAGRYLDRPDLLSDNAVWVVHPDGTEAHRVTPDNFGNIVGAGLTWSPDGRYLIGVDDLGMVLFDLDGNGVRLPATNGNTFPSWKP